MDAKPRGSYAVARSFRDEWPFRPAPRAIAFSPDKEIAMRFYFTFLSMLALALLTGCATVSVERARNVSSAGVAYAQATAGVIDVAMNASIDASSERQVRSKPRPPVSESDQ